MPSVCTDYQCENVRVGEKWPYQLDGQLVHAGCIEGLRYIVSVGAQNVHKGPLVHRLRCRISSHIEATEAKKCTPPERYTIPLRQREGHAGNFPKAG